MSKVEQKLAKKRKRSKKEHILKKTSKVVQTICLPDKTSKPVRLKKNVAQIGPDKTSS